MDNWRKGKASLQPRRRMEGGTTTKAPNPVNVSTIIPQQTLAYLKKARQKFSNLGMTLTQGYENLSSKGFIKSILIMDLVLLVHKAYIQAQFDLLSSNAVYHNFAIQGIFSLFYHMEDTPLFFE